MMDFCKRFLKEDDGPTAVEYAVILSLIVAACITTVQVLATSTADSFDNTATEINTAFGS